MKRIFIILLSIIVPLTIIWVYQTNKFVRNFETEYLPILEKNKSKFSYESVEIDKYKSTIIFNKVKIFPNIKFLSFYTDQFVIKKSLCSNKIFIDLLGNNVRIPNTETILYSPNHHISIIIDKPFFKKYNQEFNSKAAYGPFNLIDSKTEKELLNLDNYKLALNHAEKDKGYFELKLNSESENLRSKGVMDQFYMTEMLKLLLPGTGQIAASEMESNLDYSTLVSKISEMHGAANLYSKVNLVYPQELLEYSLTLLENSDSLDLTPLLNAMLEKKLFLNLDTELKDRISDNNLKLKLSIVDTIDFNITSNNSNNYNQEQRVQSLELLSDYMQKTANRDFNKFVSNGPSPIIFVAEDFTDMLAPTLNISHLDFEGNVHYDRRDNSYNSMITTKINNFEFEYSGIYKDKIYSGVLNFSRPIRLLNHVTKFCENDLSPLTEKLKSNNSVKSFKKLISAVKQFGPEALEVINKNGSLKNDQALLVTIESNIETKDTKINGKSLTELLMDERIQKLIQNLNPDPENNSKEALKN